MKFTVIRRTQPIPQSGTGEAYLKIDMWNDYAFVTMFDVFIFDQTGTRHDIGAVKIGFQNQTTQDDTYSKLGDTFTNVPAGYSSVGQDVSYYRKLRENISPEIREVFLRSLNDMVFDRANQLSAAGQEVFRVSLLRSISISSIEGQFRRVINGGAPLTDFHFNFLRPQTDTIAGIDLSFDVNAESTPSTNIHAIIGRNGVGKTTLLNDMIAAIMSPGETQAMFYEEEGSTQDFSKDGPIDQDYFSSLISVAFSAFDPFNPPQEQADPEKGTCYYYVGLKDNTDSSGILLKTLDALRKECVYSLKECFSNSDKRERWRAAITTLESDENFARMKLHELADKQGDELRTASTALVERMSSVHAVVLLVISRLIAKVEEKTLVLIDEPESHLHPPLLSALTRALSELLHQRNGVAIIATHSPVVLQEVPRSCAWVITRSRLSMHAEKPRIETFGENVGMLTREVFGLEVSKSGFHSLLEMAVSKGSSYDKVVDEYDGQIGQEARGILRAMIAERDARSGDM